MVFIAWPALQNSQKDTALRQDTGRIASALESIMVDNQGQLPQLPASGSISSWDSSGNIGSLSVKGYVGQLSAVTRISTWYGWAAIVSSGFWGVDPA